MGADSLVRWRIQPALDCAQGGLALDPRRGSVFLGGISTSPIYRRFVVDFAGSQIDVVYINGQVPLAWRS